MRRAMIGVGEIIQVLIGQFLTITDLTGRAKHIHGPAFQIRKITGHLRHGKNANQSYRGQFFQSGFGCNVLVAQNH